MGASKAWSCKRTVVSEDKSAYTLDPKKRGGGYSLATAEGQVQLAVADRTGGLKSGKRPRGSGQSGVCACRIPRQGPRHSSWPACQSHFRPSLR